MALTHELDNKDSPIRRWFEARLPNAKPISKDWNARVRAVPIMRPVTDERIPGTVGTAFDYRLRYHLASTPLDQLVAAMGMRLLDPRRTTARAAPDVFLLLYGPPPPAASPVIAVLEEFATRLEAALVELAPAGRYLDDDAEATLCRYCYVLGWFEELYRGGVRINSPLYTLRRSASVDDLLALPPQVWIDDLCALAHLFAARADDLIREPLTLNPTFAGSGDIEGADADLIADGCLIDIKTTVDPKFTRTRLLYQLLGYVLLDYDDAFAIDAVGVYLSRQGLLIRWSLDELLATLADSAQVSLPELRASFRDAVLAARAARVDALRGRARD